MGSLTIQDGFEPYYAGCRNAEPVKTDANTAKPKTPTKTPRVAKPAKPLATGPRGNRTAVPRPPKRAKKR